MDEGDDKKLASCFVENGIMEIVKVRALRTILIRQSASHWTSPRRTKFDEGEWSSMEPWWKPKRNIQAVKKSELLHRLSKKNFHAHNTGREMFASNSQMSKFQDRSCSHDPFNDRFISIETLYRAPIFHLQASLDRRIPMITCSYRLYDIAVGTLQTWIPKIEGHSMITGSHDLAQRVTYDSIS